MKKESISEEFRNHFDQRIGDLEDLVKLSLMSNALSEYDKMIQSELTESADQIIAELGLFVTKSELFGEKLAVYVSANKKLGIKDIRYMKSKFDCEFEELIIIFELEKVTSSQRTKFIDEKISFSVKGKELYITQ